jgi:transcriptional regulator with XRE-family HTH domain
MKRAPELLCAVREATGLSQAALARRARIPRSVLNAYERGKREPGIDAVAAILGAVGYRLEARPMIDVERNARILSEVIDLAERLPYKPRKTLRFPRFSQRIA